MIFKSVKAKRLFIASALVLLTWCSGICEQSNPVSVSTADLTLSITAFSPEYAVLPMQDSLLFIALYKNGIITNNPLRTIKLEYNNTDSIITAVFEKLPVGNYIIKMKFEKFNYKQLTHELNLSADTTINLKIQPRELYYVEAMAEPKIYEIYCGYVNRHQQKPIHYARYESDIFTGMVKFSVLGGKSHLWKIKIKLIDDTNESGTEIQKKFSENSFKRQNPFTKNKINGFEWLKLKKIE